MTLIVQKTQFFLNLLNLINSMIVLHYLLYVCHRAGGMDRSPRYNRWRALCFFGAINGWLLLIMLAWIKIHLNIDLYSNTPIWMWFIVAAALTFLGQLLWRNNHMEYEATFNAWPKRKRTLCNIGVAVFVISVLALLMYSATLDRGYFFSRK